MSHRGWTGLGGMQARTLPVRSNQAIAQATHASVSGRLFEESASVISPCTAYLPSDDDTTFSPSFLEPNPSMETISGDSFARSPRNLSRMAAMHALQTGRTRFIDRRAANM